jgi:hypothetical protein
MIIGFSGKKQSGKTTSGNFILSVLMSKLNISSDITIDAEGRIVVSDLLGQKQYAGVFDPISANTSDFIIKQVMDKINPLCKIYSFADPLKQDVCINILGLTYDQCYGSDDHKNSLTDVKWPDSDKHMTARDVMQFVGTDFFRKMKTNVWVDATINKIKKEKPRIALITDCRFPNEVESIRNNQGKVVRLTKKLFDSDHISENILDQDRYDWDNFDYIIDNYDMSIYDQCIDIKQKLQEILPL